MINGSLTLNTAYVFLGDLESMGQRTPAEFQTEILFSGFRMNKCVWLEKPRSFHAELCIIKPDVRRHPITKMTVKDDEEKQLEKELRKLLLEKDQTKVDKDNVVDNIRVLLKATCAVDIHKSGCELPDDPELIWPVLCGDHMAIVEISEMKITM